MAPILCSLVVGYSIHFLKDLGDFIDILINK